MIIDFHAHTFPDKIAAAAVSKLEQKAHACSHSDGTREGLLRCMRSAGIDHAVVLPVATNPLKCASMNDTSHALNGWDNLTYFAAIHPDAPDWHEELGRAKQLGFKGVKIHPVYQDVAIDDPRFVRILARCGELGLLVVMHGGADIGFPGVEKCSPAMLRRALDQAGPVTLVAAHMGGWRNWQEVPEHLLDTCVYLDTAYTLGSIAPIDDHYAPEELPMLADERFCELVRIFGSQRVLFGTDSPWDDMGACVARIRNLPLTEVEKTDIFSANARKLLSM
ncbi:MAG: amidohydrolase family protein [Clostridia bacterium]|nr:amidohydrolase family protein [Clostridia bacterium]